MFNITKIQQLIGKMNTHDDFQKMSKDSAVVLISKVFGAAILFLAQIPLARLLGAEGYGTYVYILSWVMILDIIVRMGLPTTIVKFFPAYENEKNLGALKGLIIISFATVFGAATVACSLVMLAVHFSGLSSSDLYTFFPLAALLLFLFSTTLQTRVFLRALKSVVLAETMENIVRPLVLVSLFLAFYYNTPDKGVYHALWANNAAVALLAVTFLLHLWRKLPKGLLSAKANFSPYKQWMSLAIPMLLMSGMTYLLNRTDIIMLGSIGSAVDAGVYGIASRISDLAIFGMWAVHSILVPMISASWQKGDKEHTQKLLTLSAWFVSLFTLAAIIVLLALGPFLLSLFGEEFSSAYDPMLVLLVARAAPAIIGPAVFLMALNGQQNKAAKILFATVAMNILGNILLIPIYGVMGAAIATVSCVLFWNITMFWTVVRSMHINPSILPIRIK